MITTMLKNIEIQASSCIQYKYVFIKLNTVDTSYTSRYSAFNKGEHQYIADKINCIKYGQRFRTQQFKKTNVLLYT